MTLRFSAYRFYFRLWIGVLPLASCLLATYLRFYSPLFPSSSVDYDLRFYAVVSLVMTFTWLASSDRVKLTQIDELFKENTGIRKTLSAVAVTYGLVIVVQFFYRQQTLSRLFLVISAGLLFLFTVASRIACRRLLRRRYSHEHRIRLLIIGADKHAYDVASRLTSVPFAASEIVGYVVIPDQEPMVTAANVFGLDELLDGTKRISFDEVVIALASEQLRQVAGLVRRLSRFQAPIRTVLDLGGFHVVRERLFTFGELQMLDLAATPLESPRYFVLKRIFDVAFSLVALAIMAPLMLMLALVIKLTSPGPILFKQQRVGLNGCLFTMYKFRTMRVTSPESSDPVFTSREDPRCTTFGALLRRSSLDELPQFLNVLKGEMSVVGPRPERPYFVEKFAHEIMNYDNRHRLKVGITGWAQVNGWRGDTSIQKRIEADLYYLQNWSFGLDLRIVAMTVVKGFVGEHAY